MENVKESDELDEIKLLASDDGLGLEEGRYPPSFAVWGYQDTSIIGPLLHAAVDNLVDSVKVVVLMDTSMDVNETDSFGRTALHLACWKGNDQIVMMLLNCPDINVNPRAQGGVTPLHLAAYFGYDDIMSTLITHPNIDLDVLTDEQQFSTAHFCLSRGHVKAFTMFLAQCYRSTRRTPEGSRYMLNVINAEDNKGRTPLHYAVWENRIHAVKLLLEFDLIRLNTADKYGFTPLHFASFKGHEEIASLLLENKNSDPNVIVRRPDMNERDMDMERSELDLYVDILLIDSPDIRASIWNFHSSEIPLLVKDYYNILWQITSSKRYERASPLNFAVEKKYFKIVYALVDANIDRYGKKGMENIMGLFLPDRIDELGKVFRILGKRDPEEFEQLVEILAALLIELIIQQRIRSKLGLTIDNIYSKEELENGFLMHQLAYGGLHELLNFFLTVPAVVKDINKLDKRNMTPLHIATKHGHVDAVEVLISNHTILRANEEDRNGITPLQMSIESKRKDIERLLINRSDVKDYVDRLYRDRQVYVDASNAILVGAALIASVTFAGWLQPPLGYTPYDGSAFSELAPSGTYANYASVGHLGTRVFWIFNSLSFFFAIATVLAGAGTLLPREDKFIAVEVHIVRRNLVLTSTLLVSSIVFVLGAFGAAGFVVLPPIFRLQVNMIITSVIGLILCLVMLCFFVTRLYRLRFVPNK